MKETLLELLGSKKALAYLSTIIIVVGNKVCGHWGYELDASQVALLVGSASAYLIGQGMQDHGEAAAKVAAGTVKL